MTTADRLDINMDDPLNSLRNKCALTQKRIRRESIDVLPKVEQEWSLG